MSRGPLDFLGGLLDGLSRLPDQIFGGGGIGGLLDGLFGGGKRRLRSPAAPRDITPKVDGMRYTGFPELSGPIAKNKPRPSPSTPGRAMRRAKKKQASTHHPHGCPGGT